MANTTDNHEKGTTGDKSGNIPTWSQQANADIESAAKEEVLNYESVNFKKLSPRAAVVVALVLAAFAVTLYFLLWRH